MPGVDGALALCVIARGKLAEDHAAEALDRAGRDDALGRAADAEQEVDTRALPGGGDRTGDVSVGDQLDARAGGAHVGDGTGPDCDVAVDPIDGTRLTANGMPNAISVIAVSRRGSMYDPTAVFYMSKLVTGPEAAELVDIDAPAAANIDAVARAKHCSPHDVTVVMLDRERHAGLIEEVRATGARIKLITDGDVAGAILAAGASSGVDLLLGIGGTPEGIIAACAIKCLGGVILGKLAPRDSEERDRALDAGHDLDRVLTTDDLVSSDDAFFAATGITDGELLKGVRYRSGGASTHTLVMRARSGTIRNVHSEHALWKVSRYSVVPY